MIRVPVTAAMVFVLLASGRVQAAVFPCPSGDVTCLIVAINTANGNGEDDTIQLEAGTYTLTAVDNETDGPNGLPSITSTLTIRGAAADTTIIAREASAPPFRILHVAAAGSLALEGLAIRGGLIHADFNGDPIPGGCGLRNLGAVTITDSTITGNLASVAEGGGLFNVGTMAITDSTIAGNGAEDGRGGAGIVSSGTMTIANSTIAGNGAVATNLGGIGNSGTLTITNSTIARNSGEVFGGISNSGTLTITDSTIADNRAHFRIAGIDNSGTLTITNSTIANNDAGIEGGGIVNRGEGTVELHNTILAKNRDDQREQPSDCSGPVTSLGNNLIGDTAGCTITLRASDLTGEPGLGAFTDDGTPGHGHFPLLPASRAINAGNDEACPPTDQLGLPRVGTCDIGAVEFPQVVEVVNASVTFEPIRATFTFTPDPIPCSEPFPVFIGTFSFQARLTNTSDGALTDLFVAVTTLTHGNLLQNADGGLGGAGTGLTVPREGAFADGVLSPDEFVNVPLIICLTQQQPFRFLVDVLTVVE